MQEILPVSNVPANLLPVQPAEPIRIRPAGLDDLPFMDALQKPATRQVGWMPTKQLEGHIAKGKVLIAERAEGPQRRGDGEPHGGGGGEPRLGYLIASDQYFKRDDLGIIYQINVTPGKRRGLIGASLLKAQFERSAWGCKLYCCWCAQDIDANRFWEAMGFVPIAFRAGSEKRSRVHIFWQKRIRAGDASTPWWFPSKTGGGSLREDRVVLPIPPGRGWEDDLPRVYPEVARPPVEAGALPAPAAKRLRGGKGRGEVAEPAAPVRRNGLLFDIPQPGAAAAVAGSEKEKKANAAKPAREKRVCDPRVASAARELRDRWLERADATPLLPQGKYDVARRIAAESGPRLDANEPTRLLDAA